MSLVVPVIGAAVFGSATHPLVTPGAIEQESERTEGGWIVTVFDNETNTYEEVMAILIIATDCTAEEAYIETWEVDHLGKSVVHCGSKEICAAVAEIIATIGIRVEVSEG